MAHIHIGDTVQWSNSRKPLGVVINKFSYEGYLYAVVKRMDARSGVTLMQVVRVSENLVKVQPSSTPAPH